MGVGTAHCWLLCRVDVTHRSVDLVGPISVEGQLFLLTWLYSCSSVSFLFSSVWLLEETSIRLGHQFLSVGLSRTAYILYSIAQNFSVLVLGSMGSSRRF